jgi:hypothetical protein
MHVKKDLTHSIRGQEEKGSELQNGHSPMRQLGAGTTSGKWPKANEFPGDKPFPVNHF